MGRDSYLSNKPIRYSTKQQFQRDGELIAFIRLYEITRSKRSLQLSLFIERVGEHFPTIESDLMHFSQMLTTSGESAYRWFEGRFPARHPFIRQVCTFLQTAESLADPQNFMKESTHMLEKISADSYKQKKDMQSPMLNAINSIPTMVTFLMVILLLLQYMGIVQRNIQFY